jgi:hypothetical protein
VAKNQKFEYDREGTDIGRTIVNLLGSLDEAERLRVISTFLISDTDKNGGQVGFKVKTNKYVYDIQVIREEL